MYIRAGDVKADDVIVLNGIDYQVARVERYRKQSRWWVNLCVHLQVAPGEPKQLEDRAVPMDVIIPWRGLALF